MNNEMFEGQTASEVVQAQREEASASSMTSNENFKRPDYLEHLSILDAKAAQINAEKQAATTAEARQLALNQAKESVEALLAQGEKVEIEIRLEEYDATAKVTSQITTPVKMIATLANLFNFYFYGISGMPGEMASDPLEVGESAIKNFVSTLINSGKKFQMVPLHKLRQNNHFIGYLTTQFVTFKVFIPRSENMEDYLREHKQLIP